MAHLIGLITWDRLNLTSITAPINLNPERWGIDPDDVTVMWVDNGSTPTNYKAMSKLIMPDIKVRHRKNQGIARAINDICHMAFNMLDIDYVTTLANDIIEPENYLLHRQEAISAINNTGVCSIKVDDAATFGVKRQEGIQYEENVLISGNHTIPRSTFKRIGYQYEGYGIYAPLDFDYCARAQAAGLRTYQLSGVIAKHLGKNNDQEYQQQKNASHYAALPEYRARLEAYRRGHNLYYKPYRYEVPER